MPPILDVGVAPEQVSTALEQWPVVSIVGFQRSGKSTLAETLRRHLRGNVRIQTASAWVPQSRGGESRGDAVIDPEIVQSMNELERHPGESCWIVDDAEVMFAYATERMLASLGERLEDRRFSMVLVRNRFVLEGEGWFHNRQTAIYQKIPTFTMQPMSDRSAVAVATEMFDGPASMQQGQWLAAISGGVPGLMSDLYRYTPPWPPQEPDAPLLAFARAKWEELDLGRPLRRLLLHALLQRVLPPVPFLVDNARRELGVLMLSGMVSAQYAVAAGPFNGGFWHLVARLGDREEIDDAPVPAELQDIGMNLELMFARTDLLDDVKEGCGLEGAEDGVLASALAASLHCATRFPSLTRPVTTLIADILGRFGVVQVLRTLGITPSAGASAAQMAEILLEAARS